jgi:hypothetical protein
MQAWVLCYWSRYFVIKTRAIIRTNMPGLMRVRLTTFVRSAFLIIATSGVSYPNASFANSNHPQGVERKPNLLNESALFRL